MVSIVSMHNGGPKTALHMNLRPVRSFQLVRNMRIGYIELCIYVISKSVYDRPGRQQNFKRTKSEDRIPQTSREILYTFGRRSYGRWANNSTREGQRDKVYGIRWCKSILEGQRKKVYGIMKFTSPPPARRQEGRRIIKLQPITKLFKHFIILL